jgi:hypothetical protein
MDDTNTKDSTITFDEKTQHIDDRSSPISCESEREYIKRLKNKRRFVDELDFLYYMIKEARWVNIETLNLRETNDDKSVTNDIKDSKSIGCDIEN